MARFTDINLASLPSPQSVQVISYDAIVASAMDDLKKLLEEAGIAYDVDALETDPLKINEEHRSYYEMLLRQRINEAIKAVLLASSKGTDLDQVCADLNIYRRTITPADPSTNTAAVMEDDEVLRRRRQLAPEGFSCAGPIGAYYFWSREAHVAVKDVGVYGPESQLVQPGQVLVCPLTTLTDGTATQEVIDSVSAQLSREDIRPLTDQVLVESPTIIHYSINFTLIIPAGPDPSAVQAQAVSRLTQLTAALHAVGQGVPMPLLYGAAAVPDSNGVSVVHDIQANAPGIVSSLPDAARTAYYCTGITVTTQVMS